MAKFEQNDVIQDHRWLDYLGALKLDANKLVS